MLQSLPRRRHRRRVYRLAQDSGATRFFEQSGLDRVAVDELLALLAEFGYDLDAVDFLDRPFRPKRARGGPRFSNGSFPVFCSSLDPETTLAEVKHWAPRTLGAAGRRVTASYWQFHCTFDGLEVDLRPQIALWPNRIHDSDYTFCNRIGAAAVRDGLDGLVT